MYSHLLLIVKKHLTKLVVTKAIICGKGNARNWTECVKIKKKQIKTWGKDHKNSLFKCTLHSWSTGYMQFFVELNPNVVYTFLKEETWALLTIRVE